MYMYMYMFIYVYVYIYIYIYMYVYVCIYGNPVWNDAQEIKEANPEYGIKRIWTFLKDDKKWQVRVSAAPPKC